MLFGQGLFYKCKYFVYSVDSKIKLTIFINKNDLAKARPHQMVKVKINKYYETLVEGITKNKGTDN